jgi:hypothetical protein
MLLTKYNLVAKIKKVEVGRAHSTRAREANAYRVGGKGCFEVSVNGMMIDDIKLDLRKTGW